MGQALFEVLGISNGKKKKKKTESLLCRDYVIMGK